LEQREDRTLPSVQFTIDPLYDVQPISPFVYGINEKQGQAEPANLTFTRLGGNRWTVYNWENNASNAGSDY
jgi:mannan endo-1,4-beta-mannosidase